MNNIIKKIREIIGDDEKISISFYRDIIEFDVFNNLNLHVNLDKKIIVIKHPSERGTLILTSNQLHKLYLVVEFLETKFDVFELLLR